uniref:Apextrin C-terminal domain-containing protein n=1 Tax=Magallana gigas TaxID=29159 RepID=A0A8W8LTD8_MAGGI
MEKLRNCFILFPLSLTIAVDWPMGTYTLVKPKTGCPPGWMEGWRRQDSEDKDNKNWIAYDHHFYGSFGRHFKFYYCTRSAHAVSSVKKWPKGNYYVLRHGGSCPSGFQYGSVFWDDEDSKNSNSYGGILPSGVYFWDTRINYCCRDDGQFGKRINLPTSHPFYLLRFTSHCQRVKGMYVREEFARFDDEDSGNKNSRSGKTPMVAGGRDHQLLYCYYWR